MKIDGTYTFEAPRDLVFQMLQDPEVLAKIIPGCEQLNLVGENEYEAALELNVGPVKGKFKGKVVLSNLNPPESYHMAVSGNGTPGFVKGTAQVRLEEQASSNAAAADSAAMSTLMSYAGDAQIGGRIASVGQRLVESAAKAMIKQSLEGVNQYIAARIQAQVQAQTPAESPQAAEPPPEIKAPSQAEFATGVAKDVLADFVPSERRPLLLGGGLVSFAFILYLLLKAGRKKPQD